MLAVFTFGALFVYFQVEMEEVEQPVVEKPPEKERLKEDDEDVDEEDLVSTLK